MCGIAGSRPMTTFMERGGERVEVQLPRARNGLAHHRTLLFDRFKNLYFFTGQNQFDSSVYYYVKSL